MSPLAFRPPVFKRPLTDPGDQPTDRDTIVFKLCIEYGHATLFLFFLVSHPFIHFFRDSLLSRNSFAQRKYLDMRDVWYTLPSTLRSPKFVVFAGTCFANITWMREGTSVPTSSLQSSFHRVVFVEVIYRTEGKSKREEFGIFSFVSSIRLRSLSG